jgi:hypothetical protein
MQFLTPAPFLGPGWFPALRLPRIHRCWRARLSLQFAEMLRPLRRGSRSGMMNGSLLRAMRQNVRDLNRIL